MKRARSALCALCLALLVPLLIRAARVLPMDNRPLVAEKYAGWSGVLRLWVCEGWPSGAGSLSVWLNRCIARFEKRHPGVYVQPQAVDAGAIAAFSDSGILPPDMLLFPPGVLASPEGLAALDAPDALRGALAGCGAWGNALYAAPVAMGGYAWAWNRAMIDGIPNDWRACDAVPVAPPSEPCRHWGAALLSLCAVRAADATDTGEAPDVALPGVDLGLAVAQTPAPSPTPAADDAVPPCRLPEGFALDGDAWQRFVNGEAAAMPVTQREVRRLAALSDQGRGPDWRLSSTGEPFTDQVLCLGVTAREGADDRQALCRAFLAWLLSDECQGALSGAGAFSTTDALSGYAADDPLAQMEAALRRPGLAVPNCFDTQWSKAADQIVRVFIENDGDGRSLWRSLAARLTKNPNVIPQQPQ